MIRLPASLGLWPRRRRDALSPRRVRIAQGCSEEQADWVEAILPLFDTRFYLETYPNVRTTPIAGPTHYVLSGHLGDYDPAPWFSNVGYKRIHGDVASRRMPPFVHYAIYGRYEGRRVVPSAFAEPASPTLREPRADDPRRSAAS